MTLLLSVQSLAKSYGARPLFETITFGIFKGDHIGLIGPNGSGKSTLLKILAGIETPDNGESALRKGTRLAYIPQDSEFPADATVNSVLLDALARDPIHGKSDLFEREAQAAVTLGKVGFSDFSQQASELSGGWRKRLAIAAALVVEPDMILMDEPTNHLDLEGILWLEAFIKTSSLSYLIVTHDRYFLEHVATQIIELNRCYPAGFFQSVGAYSDFLVKRSDFLAAQERHQDVLTNKVRREVEWLRRGPKARTTKAQGRIAGAEALIENLEEVKFRNAQSKRVGLDFTASERQTRQLIAVKNVSKSLGERPLFDRLSFTLSPGTRLGLAGPNGSGKTTLLRLLAGTQAPDSGTIKTADTLRLVVFDQTRESLNKTETLRRALAPEGDSVIYQDRSIHIVSWARRFLFRPEQLDMPVGKLSGGEQARILIARLMRQPADVLLLDEPTNDLDIPTLEVLEESLLEFPGALVLVTHDRYLLDRVSTTILGLDGRGDATLFADYEQWETHYKASKREATRAPNATSSKPSPDSAQSKKLSYRDKREWDQMEAKILKAETTLAELETRLHAPEVATDPDRLQALCVEFKTAQDEVDRLYARWAELEAKLT